MPGVEREGDAATCGDTNTGSTDVFADGAGITRVGLDMAIGLILGPGSQTVFVNDLPVSLPGDIILPHVCCGLPGCSPHCAATTTSESTTVFAGTGFPTESGGGGTGGGGDEEATVAPDVLITSFILAPLTLPSDPNTSVTVPGSIGVASYTVTNAGATNTGPFTVGIFETDETAGDGPFMLTEEGAEIIGAWPPLEEKRLGGGLPPFGSYSGEFILNLAGLAIGDYVFSVYADIYEEIFEPDEDNTSVAQRFEVT